MILEVDVYDPREIRQISESAFEMAREEDLEEFYVALNHHHTSLLRGQRQDFRGLNHFDFGFDHPSEALRTDAGDTWPHSPESRCYEKLEKVGAENTKRHRELMLEWGDEAVGEIEDFLSADSEVNPDYESGDVYDAATGRQIAGLSIEARGDYVLRRMCFYDGREHGDEFHELIETDLELAEMEGLQVEDPRDAIQPVPGLYDHLTENAIDAGIEYRERELGQPADNARPPTYCPTQKT